MNETTVSAFGPWLQDRLRSRRWSVQYLAGLLGVHQKTPQSWVAGRSTPNPARIEKIAQVLDVPVGEVWEVLGRDWLHAEDAASSGRALPVATAPAPLPIQPRSLDSWLREESARRGLSAEALSVRLGVDAATVRFWTSGLLTPSSTQVPTLAAALGVPHELISCLMAK